MSDELRRNLSRWSQRKLAARHGGAIPGDEVSADKPLAEIHSPASPVHPQDETLGDKPADAAALDQSETADSPPLPAIEELNAQSDYTGFMARGVPEQLKRAALRKLWASDPILANLDGLNDYEEDFNVVDTVITMAQTSYRPGRGYFDEVEEKLAKAGDALEADQLESKKSETDGHEDSAAASATASNGDIADLSNNDAPPDKSSVALQKTQTQADLDTGDDSDRQQQKNPDDSVS